jgi:RHS repeat-associated protein
MSRNGTNPTAFAWNEESGYQSDGDSGLKLLGHRYYDSRTGRFISQDPAGDGDNWYAYCGNDPTDGVDPEGLKELEPTDDPNIPNDWWNHPELYTGCNPGDTFQGWTWTGSAWTQGQWSGPVGTSGGGASGGGDVTGPADANNFGVGGFVDEWVTFGAVTHAGNVAGAYDSGRTSRGAALGAGALAVGAIVAAGASEGRDAAEVDTARFIEAWGKGTFETVEKSWAYHFEKHGEEVGAESLLQYLRKAEGFNQNLRGATKSVLDSAIRHSKNGKYIIKDFEGKILSFGSIR